MENKVYSKFDTVVQSNSIIQATHKLNRNELLTFKKLISMVDTKNAKREIRFTKDVIVEYLFPEIIGKDSHYIGEYYIRAHNYCKKLMNIILEFNTKERKIAIAFCSKLTWENYQNLVELRFTDDIMPYIYEMKKNFTTYQIGTIQKLKSTHALRLYEYCKMHLHDKKWTWIEPIIFLKKTLGIEKKYINRIDMFLARVIDAPISEINGKTDITISYKKLRNGRTIDRIEFTAESIF